MMNSDQFGWQQNSRDEMFHDETEGQSYRKHYPLHVTYHHAEGPSGILGPELPSGRMYDATVREVWDSVTRSSEKPEFKDSKFGYNYTDLHDVQEFSGIDEVADQISNAMDFMDTTQSNEVNFEHDEHQPSVESTDLLQNLREKRPGFPTRFATPERAKHVAELLIKRRDANIPLTPRPRR